jgi:ferredoxin
MGAISSFGNEPGNPAIEQAVCTLCGACVVACPVGVLTRGGENIAIDRNVAFGCIACGHCMMVCPKGCITVAGRGVNPADLVDLPRGEERAAVGQLEALMLARRSVRHFNGEEVPREMVERVVAAAATAPMGIPPWEVGVTVFHGRDKVRTLAWDTVDAYEGFLKYVDNPLAAGLLGLLMKKSAGQWFESFIIPLGRELVAGRKSGKDLVLYDAPAALMFHVSPYADGADAFIACTYAMLAAESLGLGTTMIGCVAPMVSRSKSLLTKYGLPAGHLPKLVLIMGHPAISYRRAIRRSFQSVRYF